MPRTDEDKNEVKKFIKKEEEANKNLSFEVAQELVEIILDNVNQLADVAKALERAPNYANNNILKNVELNQTMHVIESHY